MQRHTPAVADQAGNTESYGIAPAGFRLPSTTHLGVVRLQVSDLARSLAYYDRVLGLREVERRGRMAVLGAVDGGRPLIELHELPGAQPVPRRGRLGLYHYAILVPDRGALGRFVSHLATLGVYAGMSDHLVSEAIYLSDPDGLGIEVYADRPRDTWRTEGRQIAMTTMPLDADDLVQAAGGEPWTGMPNGTVIGHVHLHVGDLAQAEAFYHDALGLDKIVWGYPGALFLSAGGYHHHLGTNTWAAGAAPAGEGDARLLEWEMILPDAETVSIVANNLELAGYTVGRSSSGTVVVHDPWGTALRIRAE
ncbi:MAG TPA: VOC family protein [Gemmatimonadaceae bacterium]|jgi:catechol 2,3-dioxygenase|nr:VOC family protein [Gemmatimonadaceae bacterium]